jgi:hypothetical protein
VRETSWPAVSEGSDQCYKKVGLDVSNCFLRLQNGNEKLLYIVDAYHGIYKLNVQARAVQHMVTFSTMLTYERGIDPKALLTSSFFNDLDVSVDGKIAFTDSSYRYARSQNRPEILDGAGRGRLFEFNPSSGELRVLLCGLHFPNGVQYLSPVASSASSSGEGDDGQSQTEPHPSGQVQDTLMVSELTRFRVLKVNATLTKEHAKQLTSSCDEEGGLYQALAQPDHGASLGVSPFIANVPGLADNVRVDAKKSPTGGSYYLFGLGSKAAHPFSLLHFVYQSNLVRDIVGRFMPMKFVEKLVPRYGLILVSDEAGNIVSSLHDPSGEVAMLSQAERHPLTGDLWLGSHSEPLSILPAQYLPPRWE